jgi:hypothetical protein
MVLYPHKTKSPAAGCGTDMIALAEKEGLFHDPHAGELQCNMIKPFGYFYFLKTFAEANFAWFFENKKSRFRGI